MRNLQNEKRILSVSCNARLMLLGLVGICRRMRDSARREIKG